MRYVFYGMIILTCLIIFGIIDQIFYRLVRLFVSQHTAQVARLCFTGSLFIIIMSAALWGHYVTRFQINVTHTEVCSPRVPESFDGYKIAQISDLHLDCFDSPEGHAFLSQMFDAIHAEKPDVIVFTGDIVTGISHEADPFISELKALANKGVPVFSVLGNHDYADYSRLPHEYRHQDMERLCRIQEQAGWTMLLNQFVLLPSPLKPSETIETLKPSESIALVGVENIGEPPFSTYGDLQKATEGLSDSIFTVLLSHNPTHWRREVLPSTNIDLTLSGHTHAVQVQVGSWSPAVWKYKEWGGLYRDDSKGPANPQFLYVNTGTGGVGPRVRIGVAPEISILKLRRSL